MPVNDWTKVDAGIFHAFHVAWIPEISRALNAGILPDGYYALPEQHAGEGIPDVLTLHAAASVTPPVTPPPDAGGTLLADAPPRVRRRETLQPASLLTRRRTLAVRHVSGHRLVAMIEIVSPGNLDRQLRVAEFVNKVAEALEAGIHVLVIDLFPPGRHDPQGLHGFIRQRLERADEPEDDALAVDKPLALLSYAAGTAVEAYVEHVAAGDPLADMPLFLSPDRYVSVPLEMTYEAAYSSLPAFWRDVLKLK